MPMFYLFIFYIGMCSLYKNGEGSIIMILLPMCSMYFDLIPPLTICCPFISSPATPTSYHIVFPLLSLFFFKLYILHLREIMQCLSFIAWLMLNMLLSGSIYLSANIMILFF